MWADMFDEKYQRAVVTTDKAEYGLCWVKRVDKSITHIVYLTGGGEPVEERLVSRSVRGIVPLR